MKLYSNISEKHIRELAKINKISYRGKEIDDITKELIQNDHGNKLEYLNRQFRYAGTAVGLTICKPEANFPDKSKTADLFIRKLITERHITINQLGTEWQPQLSPEIQICSIEQDDNDVYLKLVEQKSTTRKSGYSTIPSTYAHFTSAVVHFSDGVIEVRCAYTYRKSYVEYLMRLLGFAEPFKWHSLTTPTKEEAREISEMLSAGLCSTHVQIPTPSVGSLMFNAQKGIDLRDDETFIRMVSAIGELGIPTDDTVEETCNFDFEDPKTKIKISVTFVMDIRNGIFKFKKGVTEAVIETVMDAFILVCHIRRQSQQEVAVSENLLESKYENLQSDRESDLV
ncbi:hypothetical protein [Brevibacillus laterosporus]|uniref:hypothetical protein n=1 Tax=Brevibacillus laterosporus TaxID=1465 RepID=UPI0018F7F777|nr:hypothetical protein [Brevibacillus laterosporus]